MTMAQDDPTKPTYVERVRANTRAYIEEILAENARLRSSAERIDAEHESLRRKLDELRAELLRRDRDAAKRLDHLSQDGIEDALGLNGEIGAVKVGRRVA